MEKTIDNSKLKVKYIIGSYKDSDDFPTDEDILYELTKDWCAKSAKDLVFTDISLKTRYSVSDSRFESFVNRMLKADIIEITKQKDDCVTYKIKINKFV